MRLWTLAHRKVCAPRSQPLFLLHQAMTIDGNVAHTKSTVTLSFECSERYGSINEEESPAKLKNI